MSSLVLNGKNLSVRRESRRLIVSRHMDKADKGPESIEVMLNELNRATVIGHPAVPVSVLQRLMRKGIPVAFISEKGRWYGTLHPDGDQNVTRRLQQYEQYHNTAARLECARKILDAKIRNQRRVLQRLVYNHRECDTAAFRRAVTGLRSSLQDLKKSGSIDELRGVEGAAAAIYFSQLSRFFPADIPFAGRSRNPPADAANALLSWTYTIVLSEVDAALRTQGLDPCIGWLHEIRDGRASLALDLLEPLRAPICDLFTLKLLNQKILTAGHFEQKSNGGTYLNEDGRRLFFEHYEPRMTSKFKPTADAAHTDLRQCIRKQSWTVLRLLSDSLANENFYRMP